MKKITPIIILISLSNFVFAQRKSNQSPDTTQPRTVVVTSAFQPRLKITSKVNFSAATPPPDSIRPQLQYDVPAKNLAFSYASPALKPLAANIDTAVHWENNNFLKAGYGNYMTPYLQAALSFGDGANSVVSVHGKYTSSKGPLPFQQFSKTNLEGIGIFTNPVSSNEWSGKIFFDNNTQYQYGFQPDSLKFIKDDLRNAFTTFGGRVALRNKADNKYGLDYNPNLELHILNDNHSASENNIVLNAPVSKSFGKMYSFGVGLTADITSYKTDTLDIDNNLFYLTPAFQFKTPNFNLNAGITPSWDDKSFALLPNIFAEAKLKEEKFILMAGWIGYYNKTTYESLASINPWLQQPTFLKNTKIIEQYAGFKGSAGAHFTYNAKLSYLNITNQPLFVNDTLTGKSFIVVNESELKNLRLHGEVGYTVQNKFSFMAGATFNQYGSLEDNEKAWGLLPVELNGALRWHVTKTLLVKGDLFFWDGPQYRNKAMQSQKLKPAFDMNAGVEFTVLPRLNVWLQLNNLFNNKYERWNQYPVLGFNALAGVVYSFSQLGLKQFGE